MKNITNLFDSINKYTGYLCAFLVVLMTVNVFIVVFLRYLYVFYNYKETDKASEIYNNILDKELENGMPTEIVDEARISFKKRLDQIKWEEYYKSWPFNESALALYNWAPVANELKTLDRKIVLNSMILKWDNIKEEFSKLIKI